MGGDLQVSVESLPGCHWIRQPESTYTIILKSINCGDILYIADDYKSVIYYFTYAPFRFFLSASWLEKEAVENIPISIKSIMFLICF